MLLSLDSGGANAGGQGTAANTGSGSVLWLLYGAGSGAGSSSAGATGGSSAASQSLGTGGTLTNADLWSLYGAGAGANTSSGSSNVSLADAPTLSAKYTSGSAGGQGGTATTFLPGGLVYFVTGATGADAPGSGIQQGSTGSTTLTLADGQSSATTTPLVYQPGSDDGPGIVLGVWTGDEGEVQFVPMSDMEEAYDNGAPEADPQGDPGPLWLPGVDGYTGHAGMGPLGWGDLPPVFSPSDAEAAKRLTGLAKMIHDHGMPVSSRSADSHGRVIVYTFADGSRYMEPVEPPSEQYIDSAEMMLPAVGVLNSGKAPASAALAVLVEAIEDSAMNRVGEAAADASDGYIAGPVLPILAILFGARPRPKPGVLDDAADAAKNAGTAAAKGADDVAGVVDDAMGDIVPIQFGRNADQLAHALRHVKGRVDVADLQQAIGGDLGAVRNALEPGLNKRSFFFEGVEFRYHAFLFTDGTVNVGRITPVLK